MNSEIHSGFINALLADASYVNDLLAADQAGDLSQRLADRLTSTLAEYVAANFRVVTQYTDDNLTGSGFSVTVWQEKIPASSTSPFAAQKALRTLSRTSISP